MAKQLCQNTCSVFHGEVNIQYIKFMQTNGNQIKDLIEKEIGRKIKDEA